MADPSLLATLLLALAITIAAKPVFEQKSPLTLPLFKHFNLANHNAVERDRHPVKRSGPGDNPKPKNINAYFKTIEYTVVIRIGNGSANNPNTTYNLHLDTESSFTWAGARASHPYMRTNTSLETNDIVNVSYANHKFKVSKVFDKVTMFQFDPSLVIAVQAIGNASSSGLASLGGFEGIDGVLGIGPTALTTDSIPTVIDSIYAWGLIPANILALAIHPYNNTNVTPGNTVMGGVINLGGTDPSLYIGNIAYANITSIPVLNAHWAIDASFIYGATVLPNITAGVIGTGSSYLYLASAAFQAYKNATGASVDPETKLLTISHAQFMQLEALNFAISGGAFSLNRDAQILPQSLNALIGGDPNKIYLIVKDIGDIGPGISTFILGYAFLQRLYCVLDSANKRVGFANTEHTFAEVNYINPITA